MPSLKGYIKRKWLESKLEQPPLVIDAPVVGTDLSISFVVHTWYEYHNRAHSSYSGEPDMVDWLRSNLRPGDVLWDIGANVGAYSLLAAKLCPEALVVSFEPFIANFSHLWDNIVLNGVTSNVHAINIGLSNISEPGFLAVSDLRAGSSHHQIGCEPGKVSQRLLVSSGDDVVSKLGIPAPTLIKLDIDGLECEAVQGLKKTLRSRAMRSLLIEVEANKSEDSVERLCQEAGLKRAPNHLSCHTGNVFNARFVR